MFKNFGRGEWLTTILLFLCLTVIVVVLSTTCNKKRNIEQQLADLNQAYILLNDSLNLVNKDSTKTIYIESAITLDPKTIMESNIYQKLNKEKQQLIKELSKSKNLLAATQIELESKSVQIDTVYKPELYTNDSIYLDFYNSDTNSNLLYKENITLIKGNLTRTFDYKYKLKINTQFEQVNKDSIKVSYVFNDPNLILLNETSFYVPTNQLTKKEKFKKGFVKGLKITASILAVSGSTYAGYKVGKNN